MASPPLVPDPSCLRLLGLEADAQTITIRVATTAAEAACPLCRHPSTKMHSRYLRRVADLPWVGWSVQLRLYTRRFFCDNPVCSRAIFTERLPSVVAPYSRKTVRLLALLTSIGFALGGEAGKRLSQQAGLCVSADMLLLYIRAVASPQVPTPRVLGVDEWSFRRGQQFGTILVDLERRKLVDLLPDREAVTFATWLKAHPGVEVVSRDRGGTFAEGARQGAPEAQQVADRFHLLTNLSERLEGFFLHKRSALKAAVADPAEQQAQAEARPPPRLFTKGVTQRQEEVSLRRHQRCVELYHRVHDLREKRVELAEIAHQLGIARRTVYYYLHMDQPPERKQPRPSRGRTPLVTPYKPYLLQRWAEGCRNAAILFQEIQALGYTASYSNVERFLAQFRTKVHKFKQEPPSTQPFRLSEQRRPLTALQAARAMTRAPQEQSEWLRGYLERLCQADTAIAQTSQLAQAFGEMVRQRQGERLDTWIAQVLEQGVPELQAFAKGLQKDYEAVKAGLTLEWSQGQVEGHIHRLKLLKRQMYGRASFPTLRQRVLRRA
jgi:transposase